MSVCVRGTKADELIERSKVEQSLALRKLQTPSGVFGVCWSSKQHRRVQREHNCVLLSVSLCVDVSFIFVPAHHCGLVVELSV